MSNKAIDWVLSNSKSQGTDRLVLLILADMADNETWECWPGRKTLAKKANTSKDTLRRSIRVLEGLGEIQIVSGGTGTQSCRYRISGPAAFKGDRDTASPEEEGVCENAPPGGAEMQSPGVQKCTQGGCKSSDQTISNHQETIIDPSGATSDSVDDRTKDAEKDDGGSSADYFAIFTDAVVEARWAEAIAAHRITNPRAKRVWCRKVKDGLMEGDERESAVAFIADHRRERSEDNQPMLAPEVLGDYYVRGWPEVVAAGAARDPWCEEHAPYTMSDCRFAHMTDAELAEYDANRGAFGCSAAEERQRFLSHLAQYREDMGGSRKVELPPAPPVSLASKKRARRYGDESEIRYDGPEVTYA